MEQVRDLGILHSCISQPEGRANIQKRYENLVDNEFRGRLPCLEERHQRLCTEGQGYEIRKKIADLNRIILQSQSLWEEYAHWN